MLNTRQQSILNYINEHGETKNAQLMELIGDCSAMTLWRDLSRLESEGKIIRYRGSAAPVIEAGNEQGTEINYVRRSRLNASEKENIAKITADLLQQDQSYFLDAGTTVYTLTKYLHPGNYNFVTSAANTAAELAKHNNYDITLLGGQLSSNTLSCSGPQAERMLTEINIDIAVMAASGYSTGSAFSSGRLAEAELKKRVIEKSVLTIMLLDSSKLTKRHPFTFATLDDIDILVGDESLPDAFRRECAEHGVLVFTGDDRRSAEERKRLFKDILSGKQV